MQITCEAPPALGGIAQYLGGLLARESGAGVRTSAVFVVASDSGAQAAMIERVPLSRLADSVTAHVRANGGNGRILLHYSGYGYDRSGAPAGLVAAIARIRRETGWGLTTLFHEVHASGYPWQRSFWQCPAQMYVARQLAHASDLSLCTSERGRARLQWISGLDGTRLRSISIPATLGEPDSITNWVERRNVCLLFGRREPKETLLASHWKEIVRFLRRLDIHELRDLGTPVRWTPWKTDGDGVAMTSGNDTSNEAIADEFAAAKFFLVETPVDLLDKSTVFANGIAHGCVPLWVKSANAATDGTRQLLLDSIALERKDLLHQLPQMSAAAREYYLTNRSWTFHWKVLRDGLGGCTEQIAQSVGTP